jgi:tetratricopeptide (TPR) repeat protein
MAKCYKERSEKMRKRKWLIGLSLVLVIGLSSARVFGEEAEGLTKEESILKKARTALEKNELYESLKVYDSLIVFSPDSKEILEAYYMIARIYQTLGKDEESLRAAERLSQVVKRREFNQQTEDTDKYFKEAVGYCYNKDFKKARILLQKVIDKYPGTIQHARALNKMGCSFYHAGLHEEAIKEYKKVIELFPDTMQAARAKRWIGKMYFEKKKYDKSIARYQEVIKDYRNYRPYASRAGYLIATLKYNQRLSKSQREKDNRQAVEEYHTFLSRNKMTENELMEKSCLWMLEGKYERAIDAFEQVLENYYNYRKQATWAQYLLPLNYRKQYKYKEAVREYQRLIEEYPDSNIFWQAVMEKGRCAFFGKDYRKALVEFQKIVDNCGDTKLAQAAQQNVKDIRTNPAAK